jgi:predicted DsbA family dithiol-disulfide isomerase
VRIAVEAGYPAQDVRDALASQQGLAATQAEDREARDAGITGVPFFIFNGRTAVSGAHNPETLLDAMAAARKDS